MLSEHLDVTYIVFSILLKNYKLKESWSFELALLFHSGSLCLLRSGVKNGVLSANKVCHFQVMFYLGEGIYCAMTKGISALLPLCV